MNKNENVWIYSIYVYVRKTDRRTDSQIERGKKSARNILSFFYLQHRCNYFLLYFQNYPSLLEMISGGLQAYVAHLDDLGWILRLFRVRYSSSCK